MAEPLSLSFVNVFSTPCSAGGTLPNKNSSVRIRADRITKVVPEPHLGSVSLLMKKAHQ